MSNGICSFKEVMAVRGDDPGLSFDGPGGRSVTRQSFAQDADINVIMSRYPNGGVPLDILMRGTPVFGDFSDIGDFDAVVNRVNQAKMNFDLLPAKLRVRFDNSIEKLLEFISVPENAKEAFDLQLISASMLEATYATRPDLRPKEAVRPPEPSPAVPPVVPAS